MIINGLNQPFLNELKHNRLAMAGACIILSLLFCALFAPFIAPYDPAEINVALVLSSPSYAHFFGTDELGRDVIVPAGACELADRFYTDNLSPQLDGLITSVQMSSATPSNCLLHQNMPNPFNHQTLISFYVRHQCRVEIDLFNVNGQ